MSLANHIYSVDSTCFLIWYLPPLWCPFILLVKDIERTYWPRLLYWVSRVRNNTQLNSSSPFWEVDIAQAVKELRVFYGARNVFSVHMNPALYPNLSQLDPIHTLTAHFFNIWFVLLFVPECPRWFSFRRRSQCFIALFNTCILVILLASALSKAIVATIIIQLHRKYLYTVFVDLSNSASPTTVKRCARYLAMSYPAHGFQYRRASAVSTTTVWHELLPLFAQFSLQWITAQDHWSFLTERGILCSFLTVMCTCSSHTHSLCFGFVRSSVCVVVI